MTTQTDPTANRWYRAPDGIFAGVCAGLAEKLDVDAWIIRLLWLGSVFFFGVGLFLYLITALVFPRKDRLAGPDQKMILGVCLSLSRRLDLPVELARLVAVLIALSSLGTTVLVYFILYFALVKKSPSGPTDPHVIDIK